MDFELWTENIAKLPPRNLTPEEEENLPELVKTAGKLIAFEFARRGRSFEKESETIPWLVDAAEMVVRDICHTVILTGGYAGVRSMSTQTDLFSDSITFSKVPDIGMGITKLTPYHLEILGLESMYGRPTGCFPQPRPFPEVFFQ